MIDTEVKVTINLTKLVEERIKKMSGYRDFAAKAITGELISSDEIDELAVKSRSCIDLSRTYDAIDKLICDHLGIRPTTMEDLVFGERRNG